MKLQHSQFRVNEAWIACRLQSFDMVASAPVDLYVLIDAASSYIFGHLLVLDEVPSPDETQALFAKAYSAKGEWPTKLIAPKLDPALPAFQEQADAGGFPMEVVPVTYLEEFVRPLQASYDSFRSQGTAAPSRTASEEQEARSMVPDSYDPCTCASGKKFKFCCKPIFEHIIEAMCAAEEGRPAVALKWLDKARSKVGDTAELLCRYAIVHSYDSDAKFHEYIERALQKNPNHPRSHYLLGLDHAEHERLNGYARPSWPVEVTAVRATATVVSPLQLDDLPPVDRRSAVGPAVVAEPDCTVWIPPGWRAEVGAASALVLRHTVQEAGGR